MNWLYSFPDLLILAAAAAVLALLIVFLPSLVQRLPWMTPNDRNTDFVLRMQATLFTMTSLVLAFTLVEAENNFRKVEALVSAEASQINRLDRLLQRYGEPAAADAVRADLLDYARAIVADEWPAMLQGQPSDRTRAVLAHLSSLVLSLDPQGNRQTMIYGEILRSYDGVAEARDQRLAAVNVALPAAYWQVVLFAVAMLLFISATMQRSAFRATVLAAQMAVIGAFLGFVFIQDQPFKGQMAVDADPFVQVIGVLERRKGG